MRASIRTMRWPLTLLLLVSCGGVSPPAQLPPHARAAIPVASNEASARRLLARFTFGARPGDVARVQQSGIDGWMEAQLAPAQLADAPGDAALAPYSWALAPSEQLYARVMQDPNAVPPPPSDDTGGDSPLDVMPPPRPGVPVVDQAQQASRLEESSDPPPEAAPRPRREELEALEHATQMTALARHVASERQLLEVMTDLFTNHFNIFFRKGPCRFLTADFVEHAIRPHVFGHFEDLLVAVARHPAMLTYLDNARSRAERPPRFGRPARGLNENYARELMELHTLGVDGGYDQHDVVEVARVLTGWSVSDPRDGPAVFEFRAAWHDTAAKRVLGIAFPAGGGEDEGRRLLHLLAEHPSTAHRIARLLCTRFVADDPPEALVTRLAATYRDTHGDLAEMLRALVRSPEFWDPAIGARRVKSPLEYVASVARATNAQVDGTDMLARAVAALGEPLFLEPVPTGFPNVSTGWLDTATSLDRMNFALAVARGRLRGITVDRDALVAVPVANPIQDADRDALTDKAIAALLPCGVTPATRAAVRAALGETNNPRDARDIALALLLASPEMQTR